MAALQRHAAVGRLTLDEFSDRVRLAYAAGTHDALAPITADLPALEPVAEAPPPPNGHRQLLAAFAIAMLTIAVLAAVLAIAR